MKDKETARVAEVLHWQMHAVPVINAAAAVETLPDGRKRVTVPQAPKRWARVARMFMPRLRDRKTYELDRLSSETLELVDGRRTVEQMVDLHMARWKLSFFEARGMIVEFLGSMLRRGIVAVQVGSGQQTPE